MTKATDIQKILDDEAKYKGDLPSVVDAIEFRRDQYGWYKADMARALGLNPSHYIEFLKGERGLPINAMRNAYSIGIPAKVLLQKI